MDQKIVLLASFIERKNLEHSIDLLKSGFMIVGSKVFFLKNKEDESKLILTYNIQVDNDRRIDFNKIPSTISLHRKKETNTLYTLNALNEIVKNEVGFTDKTYQIAWKNYVNCILITKKHSGLIKIETELERVFDLAKDSLNEAQ